ncbi:hypothetical protein O988_04856, partial [Pseudogymnoascus sp. VKM F-3808]
MRFMVDGKNKVWHVSFKRSMKYTETGKLAAPRPLIWAIWGVAI